MSITKQDIDSFVNKISYIVRSPFLTYWERREFVKGLKQSPYSELNNWHAEHCVGALYAKDRKKIEENDDIELVRYLSKLMLYTINGETDNSWLEDKYKEYHDKYDFSENKVFTSSEKVEKELNYIYSIVDWTPSQEFIDSIQKDIPNYLKSKNTLINAIWRMVDFVQNKKRDKDLYKTLVRTLCLELCDDSSMDIMNFIEEIKDTFEVYCMSFTTTFEVYFKKCANEKDIMNGLKDHPNILEMLLNESYIYDDIKSINELQTALNESIDSILVTVKNVYGLLKEEKDGKQDFISGFQNGPISKLTENYVGGFIVSHINHEPVTKLIQTHQKDDEAINIILETCKAMNIHKHFYSEYKKVMGVSYTNRNKSSPPKGVKGSKADIVVIDEVTQTYKAEGKPPAEKIEQTAKFDTETSYITDFQKIKLREYQKDFLKKEDENSLKLGVKENTELHYESFKNPLINTSVNTKELINKIEESPIKPDVIYITKEGFTEMQEHPLSEVSSEVKKDPRKEAYIKGIYLGIVRELVKNTKELFSSSFNNPSVIGIVNTALGDVVISAVLVEILPMINFGARKDFVDKVVELLKLNTSVAIGEFATNILIGIGKELAKDNKIQEIVKQVVTV